MRRLMLGAALCAAVGVGAETATAKSADLSVQRTACRLVAGRPLKLLLAESGVSSPTERVSRRAIYTPVPVVVTAREQGSFLAVLERQPKPASLIVGIGY
jgi:hypothetical protein